MPQAKRAEYGKPNVPPRAIRFPGGLVSLEGFSDREAPTPTTLTKRTPALCSFWLTRAQTAAAQALGESDQAKRQAFIDELLTAAENAWEFAP